MGEGIDKLRERVRGEIITSDDEAYEEARRVYNAMIDRRPRVIVKASDAGDVMAAVDFARENDVDLAVRGGGHSVPGFGTCDDGVVIDLGGMRGVRVDAQRRTARADGGATLGRPQPRHPRLRPGHHRRHHLDDRDRRASRWAAAWGIWRASSASRSTTSSRPMW